MTSTQKPKVSAAAQWLTLDGVTPGFTTNQAPLSRDLEGLALRTLWTDGTLIDHNFGPDGLSWHYLTNHGDRRGYDPCQVFEIDKGLYYLQFQRDDRPIEAPSVFFDLTRGVGLSVIATIDDVTDGTMTVRHQFEPFIIEGHEPSSAKSPVLATDANGHTTCEIRPEIFVVTWREKVVPRGAVIITDERDQLNPRSRGAVFGLDASGTETVHFTFATDGADGDEGADGSLPRAMTSPPGKKGSHA
ncbi:MAG: MoaF N-terminal domain-containing protein [Actinomycetales bacterium]|nr:MoaF N-terminal domain-containing protein [Actinomycetales bacterium]